MMNNNKLNTLKRRALVTAISCVYMSLAIAPAYASDTEIYVDSSNASAVAPNLMMLFDTSGSMQWCVDDDDNSTCSDVDKRRINVLKKAMTQILRGDTAEGISPVPGYIRMGLSRYHTTTENGGYVMYPVRPLDAFVEISPTGIITSESPSSAADAIQKSTQTSSGTTTSGALKVGLDGTNDYVMGLQFNNVRFLKGGNHYQCPSRVNRECGRCGLTTWEIAPKPRKCQQLW
ncbi:MAG: hypothetical protein IPL02_02555 [Moraxellaceae bacterium]|nr:hypothetical protein [Moraxellaceae bacterium]